MTSETVTEVPKRGRKPRLPAVIQPDVPQFGPTPPDLREQERRTELAVAEHDQAVRRLAREIGYSLPANSTEPDMIQVDITSNMRRSVDAVLEIGRGLTVLKAACEHGDFMRRIETLGVEYRLAAKFMQAAVKFSNVPTSAHLKT
jgi:hypothetical protein